MSRSAARSVQLSQRHLGTFDRKTLPGSWASTENALEARLFTPVLFETGAGSDDGIPVG